MVMVFLAAGIGLVAFGCQSGGQTGALTGGGIGALAGQAVGGNTESTLIGAAIGAGVGYIIGNEADKAHAQEMTAASPGPAPKHNEVGNLGGTRWQLISLNPSDAVAPYERKIVEFRPDGRVLTSTTEADGSVITMNESYRVVGDTLIINKPGYLINAFVVAV